MIKISVWLINIYYKLKFKRYIDHNNILYDLSRINKSPEDQSY